MIVINIITYIYVIAVVPKICNMHNKFQVIPNLVLKKIIYMYVMHFQGLNQLNQSTS